MPLIRFTFVSPLFQGWDPTLQRISPTRGYIMNEMKNETNTTRLRRHLNCHELADGARGFLASWPKSTWKTAKMAI
jgi:hypothetical protein